jgi:hypothetical protein
LPASPYIGKRVVGAIEVIVTDGTDFAFDDRVEVTFHVDAAGKRTAEKIECEDSECRVGEHGRDFGFVNVQTKFEAGVVSLFLARLFEWFLW